jgi:hypothetical protein
MSSQEPRRLNGISRTSKCRAGVSDMVMLSG